jgi:hypothetical protein
VISWFHKIYFFKCNLYRYVTERCKLGLTATQARALAASTLGKKEGGNKCGEENGGGEGGGDDAAAAALGANGGVGKTLLAVFGSAAANAPVAHSQYGPRNQSALQQPREWPVTLAGRLVEHANR